ncbi:hypothetical protein QT196_20715 [Streptomyces sp. P9-2B-2]|uniref:hypothetical protein n=1 Tax=Streptomyces sp. P9-2B-2 TaxID=3057114 RepID=UPI0025B3D3F3|nr:hypothetical protein [Streptomyces sp. P9-2B-2]WJY39512.1 hypothetical protein QT196_20715 [Streptomyces sp. P9-2B-2]
MSAKIVDLLLYPADTRQQASATSAESWFLLTLLTPADRAANTVLAGQRFSLTLLTLSAP